MLGEYMIRNYCLFLRQIETNMAAFHVHPHFGYLNSDVRLINKQDSRIVLKDTVDDKEYEVPASSSISVRLTAGKHVFVAADTESPSETVIVEDAIKLGGSKEKKTYIFEGTPWALMVMLDRTYFYNRETGEQYLEHGLVPQSVKYLTSDYLLFVSENDNSIFSLDTLSVEKVFSNSSFLYNNDHYAVFSTPDGIALYSLDSRGENTLTILTCDDYALDKVKKILYVHSGDKREIMIKSLSGADSKIVSYKLPDSFRCFVGTHSVVYGWTPLELDIMDLRSQNTFKLHKGNIPVTKINGKEIWENYAVLAFDDTKIQNMFTSYTVLTVYERTGRWLINRRTRYKLKNNGRNSSWSKYVFYASDTIKPYLESDQPFTVTKGKSFDCVETCPGKGILVFKDSVRPFEGRPIVSPDSYILIETKDLASGAILTDPLDPIFRHPSPGIEAEVLFTSTGLIKQISQSDSSKKKTVFQNLSRHQTYDCSVYEDLKQENFYRLSGDSGDFVHSLDGHVRKMPCSSNRLIAISEQCNYAIVRSEDGIKILSYNPAIKDWNGSLLGEMVIDESFYSKAVFCSDGETIIYQKQGAEYFIRQIGSEIETEFVPQGSVIKRNINGYIPYLDFDTHRRPVYVDPVSLTRIEAAAAGQFSFQSVDGSIKHIKHNLKKYKEKRTGRYVSEDEYKEYVAKYDYTITFSGIVNGQLSTYYDANDSRAEEVRQNRRVFYEDNQSWLDEVIKNSRSYGIRDAVYAKLAGASTSTYPDCLSVFLEMGSICDTLLFDTEYYVREEMQGENLDIKLPDRLYFLNYVAYSPDNKYILISGRFLMSSKYKGLALVYDVVHRQTLYESTSTKAVWSGAFSKHNTVAFYSSTPCTIASSNPADQLAYEEIKERSFLTFSPSGNYIAFSKQGYIPYISGSPRWGHQPSTNIYIAKSDSPQKELVHYCDHGESIARGLDNSSVASATFSKDDKKLMTVSNDGVVVIRNLHL